LNKIILNMNFSIYEQNRIDFELLTIFKYEHNFIYEQEYMNKNEKYLKKLNII
jgi:hypothetical protein